MGFADWYKRLRHSKGYGVHSPFAFRMVLETLNPPRGYRYYAEEAFADPDHRLVYRIIVALQPSEVHIIGSDCHCESLKPVIRSAAGCFSSQNPPLAIVTGASGVIPSGVSVFTLRPMDALFRQHVECFEYGHLYSNSRRALFVARQGLPFQCIRVNF